MCASWFDWGRKSRPYTTTQTGMYRIPPDLLDVALSSVSCADLGWRPVREDHPYLSCPSTGVWGREGGKEGMLSKLSRLSRVWTAEVFRHLSCPDTSAVQTLAPLHCTGA